MSFNFIRRWLNDWKSNGSIKFRSPWDSIVSSNHLVAMGIPVYDFHPLFCLYRHLLHVLVFHGFLGQRVERFMKSVAPRL